MSLSDYFLLFLIYSFIGWIWETLYCSLNTAHFVNRGFLYGPLCPIYGFGGLLIMYLLHPLAETWWQLFLAAAIVCSVLEYFTSWLLEALFHTRWWDYSRRRFNLHGRIFLGGALCFGLMGTLAEHFVQPFLTRVLTGFPETSTRMLATVLLLVLILDLLATLGRLVQFTQQMNQLRAFLGKLRQRFGSQHWFVGHAHSVEEAFHAVRSQVSAGRLRVEQALLDEMELLAKKQRSMAGLARKFPSMMSLRFKAGVENLHQHLHRQQPEKVS